MPQIEIAVSTSRHIAMTSAPNSTPKSIKQRIPLFDNGLPAASAIWLKNHSISFALDTVESSEYFLPMGLNGVCTWLGGLKPVIPVSEVGFARVSFLISPPEMGRLHSLSVNRKGGK
jgi:hypothetical protein